MYPDIPVRRLLGLGKVAEVYDLSYSWTVISLAQIVALVGGFSFLPTMG
jgi:hypothetical protein